VYPSRHRFLDSKSTAGMCPDKSPAFPRADKVLRRHRPKRERYDRDSDGDRFPLLLEVAAYSIFGGVSVKRG
jgi:hypothetical protein